MRRVCLTELASFPAGIDSAGPKLPKKAVKPDNRKSTAMNLEPELKFRLSPRKLASLGNERIAGAKTGPRAARYLVSTYYDAKNINCAVTASRCESGKRATSTYRPSKRQPRESFARNEWEELA